MKLFLFVLITFSSIINGICQNNNGFVKVSANPIVPNVGLTDSHIHVYNGRLYNYATHDYSHNSKGYMMKDWWVWSSEDLVNWTFESELCPTILGFGNDYKHCWATDSQYRNGKYYWYVCNPESTYVVSSDTPVGPWTAPLGNKPLISGRDPSVFVDEDEKAYVITGVWDYKIAELNSDMISLKDSARTIKIINPVGPYNKDGKNTERPTDDKPFLHKYNGKYYLSWGCYYAISDNIFGPYVCKGSFITPERTDSIFIQHKAGVTYDRHGSFFEWKNQTYFCCNDLSSNRANNHWRNTVIAYVHYRENGEIAPVYLKQTGVGIYDALSAIEAEDYYDIKNGIKHELDNGGFGVRLFSNGELYFQNVNNIKSNSYIAMNVCVPQSDTKVEVWRYEDTLKTKLGECVLPLTNGGYKEIRFKLNDTKQVDDICLVFKGMKEDNQISIDYFSID